jgi:hypothetical protein
MRYVALTRSTDNLILFPLVRLLRIEAGPWLGSACLFVGVSTVSISSTSTDRSGAADPRIALGRVYFRSPYQSGVPSPHT